MVTMDISRINTPSALRRVWLRPDPSPSSLGLRKNTFGFVCSTSIASAKLARYKTTDFDLSTLQTGTNNALLAGVEASRYEKELSVVDKLTRVLDARQSGLKSTEP